MKKILLVLITVLPSLVIAECYPFMRITDTLFIEDILAIDSTTRPMGPTNTWDYAEIITSCSKSINADARLNKIKFYKKYTGYTPSVADTSMLHVTSGSGDTSVYVYAKMPISTIVGTGLSAAESVGFWSGSIRLWKDDYFSPTLFTFRLVKNDPINVLDSLKSLVDSLQMEQGLKVGYRARTVYTANADTIFIIRDSNSDTLWDRVYYHVGGIAGQRPDSVKKHNR